MTAVIQFQMTESYDRRPEYGRSQAADARNDRVIVSISLWNQFVTSVEESYELLRVRAAVA